MLDLIAVGDVMLDVLAPSPRGPRTHAPIRVRAGGSAVNVARAAKGAKGTAAVVGRVGDDAAGRMIADELGRARVDALLARDPDRPTGTAVALGDAVVADRGANAGFAPADVPPTLEARVVLVSGYLLFHDDSAEGAQAALQRAAGLTAVDLASPSLARPVEADVLLGPGEAFATLAGTTVEEAVARLAAGGRTVCATLGAGGAIAARDGTIARARPEARPGNPLGAGDAFAAGFLLALADGAGLEAALARGCVSAAAV